MNPNRTLRAPLAAKLHAAADNTPQGRAVPFMLAKDTGEEPGATTDPSSPRQILRRLRDLQADARARVALLTRREREVLELMAKGYSNKAIGEALGISSRTVEIHRGNMNRNLRAQCIADAVRIWFYTELPLGPE